MPILQLGNSILYRFVLNKFERCEVYFTASCFVMVTNYNLLVVPTELTDGVQFLVFTFLHLKLNKTLPIFVHSHMIPIYKEPRCDCTVKPNPIFTAKWSGW